MAMPGQPRERPRGGETAELAPVEPGPQGKRLHAVEAGDTPRLDQPQRRGLREALHQTQTEPQRECLFLNRLERAVPVARIDVDRSHLDTVTTRILHKLRRRIEPHRLAVDERSREGCGLVALEPGRDVHEQRETCGVRFRKSVLAEPEDLPEDLSRELLRVTALPHPVDETFLERTQPALALPGRHRPAQVVRLAGRETRCDDGEL